MKPEPTVGDALEASARALEAVADILRRLADREDFAHLREGTGRDKGALSLAGAARALDTSRGFIKSRIASGEIKAVRYSPRVWRVPLSELESYRRRRAALTLGGAAPVAATS